LTLVSFLSKTKSSKIWLSDFYRGDFYQEFTEDPRGSGEKAVEGYVIKL
jgi:hypothetical protein